jgi:hypothetical protein
MTHALGSLLDALRSRRTLAVSLLSFASGLPLGLVWYAIPDWMRDIGADIRVVGLITLAQAPWIDEARERILVIGGNVRGIVALKLSRAQREARKPLRVVDPDEDERPVFAHLRLRAAPIATDALDTSATLKAVGCTGGARPLALVLEPRLADVIVASC